MVLKLKRILFLLLLSLGMLSCSLTKYVPENESLLNRVRIKENDTKVPNSQLKSYVVQKPNSMMLGFMRVKLATYSLSGMDTTVGFNRFLRKIGEPPVILDTSLITQSRYALQQSLKNRGYLDSEVSSYFTTKSRKSNLYFRINSGRLYKIRYFHIDVPNDSAMRQLNRAYQINSFQGDDFDIDELNNLRNTIAQRFRYRGFYHVQKDVFEFAVDTIELGGGVDVKLMLASQYRDSAVVDALFSKKTIDKVTIYCFDESAESSPDTTYIRDVRVIYNSKRRPFQPRFLADKVSIKSGTLYNEFLATQTHSNFSSIPAIKYVNITFAEKEGDLLDCQVYLMPSDRYGYDIGVEANTNSGATVGVAGNVGFINKNLFRRGEYFKIDGRVAYDWHRKEESFQHAVSVGANMSLVVPKLLIPYLKEDFRLHYGATTRFAVGYNYQTHPDYRRSIANTSMTYQWQQRRSQFGVSIFNLSYIKVDSISLAFLINNPNLRPTFEDHLVLKTAFSYSTTNKRLQSDEDNFYTLRTGFATGGNLFYLGYKAFAPSQMTSDGRYEIFRTPFAQFVKADLDISYNRFVSNRLRLVMHAMAGVGLPYGNATIMPFEERFFAGGSNSMRGWGARTLGPGKYYSLINSFLTQNGDVKLELNAEARFKMFWVLEGAFFVDAGNVWTIKAYEEQEGGEFSLKNGKFLSEIAVNYGVGLRLDFDYFLIRFDLGVKLYDPRYDDPQERWALTKRYGGGRDHRLDSPFAIQFAIGYPF